MSLFFEMIVACGQSLFSIIIYPFTTNTSYEHLYYYSY